MAFAPGAVFFLLRTCCLLFLLGYGSRATGQPVTCPLIAPLSAFSPSISCEGSSPITPRDAVQLESAIATFISNNSSPLHAVFVVHENQMVFTSGLATTPFMVGFVTKTFTALGALILRERGLLSLDDPVKKFLPNFSVINPYEPHDITLRKLMGQVLGLPRELCKFELATDQSELEEHCLVEESDVLASVVKMQLARPPWSREPAYSNLGFGLLGHSWEKATSPPKSWVEFLQDEIFKPLDLKSTGMSSDNVTLANNRSSATLDLGYVAPAGNLYSTVTDLTKYLIFLLKASPRLISVTSIHEWTHSRTIFPDGNSGYALPWELAKVNATGNEFLITKVGILEEFRTFIAIHEPTQLRVSAVLVLTISTLLPPDNLVLELLNLLIPIVEATNAEIIDAAYMGHYVCKATPPIFSQPLDATVETEGGYLDITGSSSLGLSAFVNISLLNDGSFTSVVLSTQGMLLKNATENSLWLGDGTSCSSYFLDLSQVPNTTDPNSPGSDYEYEIEFDLKHITLLFPAFGSVCVRT